MSYVESDPCPPHGIERPERRAAVGGSGLDRERLERFLPSNYRVVEQLGDARWIIAGRDHAGWTLDDYVLPRLASGSIYGRELES